MKLLSLLLLVTLSFGATKCPQMFVDGIAPLTNQPIKEVCYDTYTVGFSEKYKNPLYSAEHLNAQIVIQAKALPRTNSFHQEPGYNESKLSAYVKSGYDRGHMTPDADMPNKKAEYQSFSMLNMCPQSPDNNRNEWAHMEQGVRDIAMKEDIYVISGPVFNGATKTLSDGTVIPTGFYKIVFYKSKKPTTCMYIDNKDKVPYKVMSVGDCEKMSGLKFTY